MASKLTVAKLKEELSAKGLDTSGKKADLVARLEEALERAKTDTKASASEEDKQASDGARGQQAEADSDEEEASQIVASKLTVPKLKEELSARGLDTSGKKADLVARLEDVLAKAVQAPRAGTKAPTSKKIKQTSDGADDSGAPPAKKAKLKGKAKEEEEDGLSEVEEEKLVTATKKGGAVLDTHLPDHIKSTYHVLTVGNDTYDAMLNQTNVGDNNNKFYVIQALESDSGKQFQLWSRWGRVGYAGQNSLEACSSKEDALSRFEKKFKDKTKNEWTERQNFTAYPKKYTLLEMDYEDTAKDEEKDKGAPDAKEKKPMKKTPETTLDPKVLSLVELICDTNMMNQQMMEIGYDSRKMPLGKLSKVTILKGYEVLKRIAAAMEGESKASLPDLSSEFYTLIPHDFGFKKMRDYIIRTPEQLKKKLEMVEALANIELATKLLSTDTDVDEHPADTHYKRLKCEIVPVASGSNEETMIKQYVDNTHAPTHTSYKLEVQQVFKVSREAEEERYQAFKDLPNKQLLWHGSRLTNWTGILSQGLRIAPPEAPVTGYMFGKGIYFADMVTKSANYCYATGREGVGLLALGEVALGKCNELTQADYNADRLPPGTHSTKGLGATFPDPGQNVVLESGVVVPLGKPKQDLKKGSLLYNEYIIYDQAQVCMRYLVKCKFNYNFTGR